MAVNRNKVVRRKKFNCRRCIVSCVAVTSCAVIIYVYSITVAALARSQTVEDDGSLSSYFSHMLKSVDFILPSRNTDSTSQSVFSHLSDIVLEDFHNMFIFLVSAVCYFIPREVTSVIAGVIIVCFGLLSWKWTRNTGTNDTTTNNSRVISLPCNGSPNKNSISEDVADGRSQRSIRHCDKFMRLTFGSVVGMVLILAFVCSLPWEFIRLYQTEVAKKMANLQPGTPKECLPGQMSVLHSLKYWLSSVLSWQPDPCEEYYRKLMVDPFWEVTPLMVVSSLVTRCITHPMELFFAGVGKSLKVLFNEIPFQWQPVLLIAIFIITMITIIILGGYRLHVPFIFKIEPKTPIQVTKNVVYHNKSPSIKASSNTPKLPKDLDAKQQTLTSQKKFRSKKLSEDNSKSARKVTEEKTKTTTKTIQKGDNSKYINRK